MNDTELLRYSKNIHLPEIGGAGQIRLNKARVLVAGLGGLGGLLSLQLAAAGIGTLVLADRDDLEMSNLNRQVTYRTRQLGQPKAASHAANVRALNPDIEVMAHHMDLCAAPLARHLRAWDVGLVVDCTDNFTTRHAINRAAVQARVPLVSVAVIGFSGQCALWGATPAERAEHGCYACLYADGASEDANCATSGVLGAMAGWVACAGALEVIKCVAGVSDFRPGTLTLFDGLRMQTRRLTLTADPQCPQCRDYQ